MTTQQNKLVFISLTNYMGGAENVLNTISNVNDSPIIFIKRVFNKCLNLQNSPRYTFVTTKPLIIGFILLLRHLIKYRKNYTIISTHPYLNAYLGFLKRIGFIKSRLIVRESTTLFSRYSGVKKFSYKLAYFLGYPSVDKIICQTDLMKNELLSHNSFIPRNKAVVKGNPIDIDHIVELSKQTQDNSLTNSYICAAGRLIELKGFEILIDAFARIASQVSDVNLVILGDGPGFAKLENLISSHNLQNRIKLAGHVSNPFPYFKHASLCVVSSLIEGFPNVLLQMIALNNKVVSTLCAGGIEEIPCISTVPVNNVVDLGEAMLWSLTNSSELIDNQDIKANFFKIRNPKHFLEAILN